MWNVRFRAKIEQVIRFLAEHGFDLLDQTMSVKLMVAQRETILAPKGAKMAYRGGGWWILHGYSDYDRFNKLPNQY